MLQPQYPYYLANRPEKPNADLEVIDKYTGEVATRVALADAAAVERAIAAAHQARHAMTYLKGHQRQAALEHCVARFEQRREELAMGLCIEAGKPIKDSRGEVGRLIDTFKAAAGEAVRGVGTGEVLALDVTAGSGNYRGMTRRVPIGPVSLITPWNFPLNLVAHKVAPAIAAGCPFVLKPASATPVGALLIGEVLAETDLPSGAFSILPTPIDQARALTTDPRFKLLSFTGSHDVGWDLKTKAGKKKVVLEMGGNAACVVDQTITGEHLDDAVSRIIHGSFYQSGQSCISVQRLLVHDDVHEKLRDKLIAKAAKLKVGNPKDEDTFIGPMISTDAAQKLLGHINDAVEAGAKVRCGGKRDGAMLQPTVLENVPQDTTIWREEAFGPVVLLETFRDYETALRAVNDSRFGLQAGVFTRDLYRAQQAWDTLEVGGVLIGEVPSWRVDPMPYGGVKDSGLGREGLRYAIEEMTQPRLLVIRDP